MKKLFRCPVYIKKGLAEMHFVDKCLCVIMLVLLTQSAYSLFGQGMGSADFHNIDVIIRTAAASIFGYFLSANFIRRPQDSGSTPLSQAIGRTEISGNQKGQMPIGFQSRQTGNQNGDTDQEQGLVPEDIPDQAGIKIEETASPEQESDAVSYKLQVTIATFIGVFCLVTLILIRNVASWNPEMGNSASVSATIVQFRDFVSGCIGFLIGCPTGGKNN